MNSQRRPSISHRYDNLPPFDGQAQARQLQNHHYQNGFFATIYDSDGANGFDPAASFERQNSYERRNSYNNEHELEWVQVSKRSNFEGIKQRCENKGA